MRKIFPVLLIAVLLCCAASAQDTTAVDDQKWQQQEPASEKVYGIFKSTRVINAHSADMLRKGNLDFRILHRFGYLNNGIKEMFGLDEASMRIGLDYGVTDNFTIGLGRSTYRKELDGFLKWRFIQQSTGEKASAISLALAAGSTVWTEESFATPKPSFADRFSYYIQVLAGRKFSPHFSMQLSPIFVHSNAPFNGEARNLFAPGLGMRYKVTKRMALTFDYHHVLDGLTDISHNPLSMGIDIETGGHVFQLHFSNATGMNERAYLYETYGKFFSGDIRFGFNLSRMFQLGKRRK
ncbi:MAG: DUF5777 family beta-barrel protein [Ferruginibacter sp.]